MKFLQNISFGRKGLSIYGITISWILIGGLFMLLAGLVFVGFSANQKIAGDEINKQDAVNGLPAVSNINDNSSGQAGLSGSNSKSSKKSGTGSSSGASGDSSNGSSGVVVALGDSITVAAGLGSSYSFAIGTSISSVYLYLKNLGRVTDAHNLAAGGATSVTVLSSQAPNVNSYSPSYVTLLVGGNDMLGFLSGGGIPPSQFQSNLQGIASKITASGRKVLIGTIPNYGAIWAGLSYPSCAQYKTYPSEIVSTAISEYNSKISSFASGYGATLINIYSSLGSGDILESDCLHPNASGQQKIANSFKSGL